MALKLDLIRNVLKTKWENCLKWKYSNIVLPVLLLFFVLLILTVWVWSPSLDNGEYAFKTKADALNTYRQYLHEVQMTERSNTKDFGSLLGKWKEVNDTVQKFLAKDSVFTIYHNEAGTYFAIHDSIRSEMMRLAETWRYGYADILDIKEKTCPYKEDKELMDAVHAAEPFFRSLDENGISVSDKQSILKRYRYFLAETKKQGIHNTQELLQFIKQEDFLFRSFLSHLYEMDNEPLVDITKDTESICRNIFLSSRAGKIPPRDVIVYMSMRTVRRLLQNSAECVDNINRLQMKNKAQGNAYVWMIIQPFISIDQFSLAMMTEQERRNFNYIITQLPKSRKFASTFDINLRELNYLLPQQLLKIYVLSL